MDRTTQPLMTYPSSRGRWVLLATVLGSALASVDGTIVTIALPAIGRDLGTSFAGLQWTVTGYTLTLASLILISGACGDRFGRRRVFLVGVVWFIAASVLCALAPNLALLVAARVLQGVGGALLTPASLAILESSFRDGDRALAIGTWAGFSGVSGALAPLAGGWLLSLGTWRWVFLLNVPLACVVVAVTLLHVPESSDPDASGRLDWAGAALTVLFLGSSTYAVIGAGQRDPRLTAAAWAVAVAGLTLFLAHERRAPRPLLPPALFRIRQFSAVNALTFVVYGAVAVFFFLLVLQLEIVSGWTPLAAGLSTVPVTVLTLALSRRSGALAGHIGPRLQLTAGPLLCAAGALLALRVGSRATFVGDVLPAVTVFGLGLSTFVAPLTSSALSAVPARHAGLASGVNNAMARSASLLAIAAVPVVAGLDGAVFEDAPAFDGGYRLALFVCAALFTAGAALAATTVTDPVANQDERAAAWAGAEPDGIRDRDGDAVV